MADMKKTRVIDYHPDPSNPNKHTERGVKMLEDSLSRVGLGRSIVVDKNNYILAGNSTQERAVDQGFENAIEVETDGKQLIVVKRTDLDLLNDGERARLLSYFDNRTQEVSLDWDADQLLADLNAGVDLSALFGKDELAELLGQVPLFEPVGMDEQPRLDQLEPIICPHCGKNIRDVPEA